MKITWMTFLLLLSVQSFAAAPNIVAINDQAIMQGNEYSFQPQLVQDQVVNWVKTYGPDEVTVNPITGRVSWNVPADLPDESFHIGVKAINSEGYDADVWIVTVGDGNVLYIGPNEDITTLKDGMAAISAGDTLVMKNGHWEHLDRDNTIPGSSGNKFQTLPGGDEEKYTTLIAEDPGQVILDGNSEVVTINIFGSYNHPDHPPSQSSFTGNTNYIAIKGLVLKNSIKEALRVDHSHHVKLINIGIGPSDTGHNGHLANVYIHKTKYVLIEGMYAWGHGRYKIQYKFSSEGIVRRSLVRIDDYAGALPLGGYISYCSRNILFQNNIMLDSDQSNYWLDHYELTNAFGVAATNCYDYPLGNVFKRSLSLNTHMGLMKADVRNTPEVTLWEDLVGWDMKPDGQGGGQTGAVPLLSGVAVTQSNNITIGDVLLKGTSGSDFYFYSRDGGVSGAPLALPSIVQDSILYGLGWNGSEVVDRGELVRNTGFLSTFSLTNNNIYGFVGDIIQNTSDVTETNTSYINPAYKYITMLPRDSQLRTMAQDGGVMGANIMTMIGKSGTVYGEDGYDDETYLPMWPFPNQEIAQQHMQAFSYSGVDRNGESPGITGDRGFAVAEQTLTNYVWGYLGETVPPFNVKATAGNERALITWEPAALVEQNIIDKYRVYQKHNNIWTAVGETDGSTFNFVVTELENNQRYDFMVKAIDISGNESDYAYATSVTPVNGVKPTAPVLSFLE